MLIIGASGGCGLSACQLAAAMGAAEVVGVCSAGNAQLARSRGATRCVDYTDPTAMDALAAEGPRFNVVYDAATGSGKGEDYCALCAKVVAVEGPGRRVAINGGLTKWLKCLTGWQSQDNKLVLTRQNGEQLTEIMELLGGEGKDPGAGGGFPGPAVDSTHPLTAQGVDAAFHRLRSRRAKGKIVLTVV